MGRQGGVRSGPCLQLKTCYTQVLGFRSSCVIKRDVGLLSELLGIVFMLSEKQASFSVLSVAV